jgi:KilA-N domain
MSKSKKSTIEVQGAAITVLSTAEGDYISLTDMLRAKDGEFFISDWLRNRNTVEFLGIWESVFNPDFNYGEFATIRNQAGLNSYKISVKDWVEKTHAIGLKATAGRYGGTFAHPDIAFEFGMWISPEFKIYLVREFRRLKDDENRRLSLAWNLNRTLSKLNYRIHTDAIKAHLIPSAKCSPSPPTSTACSNNCLKEASHEP